MKRKKFRTFFHSFSIFRSQVQRKFTYQKLYTEDFWEHIKEAMVSHFKEGKFAKGLENGIAMAGKALAEHFPYQDGDVNELSDDIIIK